MTSSRNQGVLRGQEAVKASAYQRVALSDFPTIGAGRGLHSALGTDALR